MTIRTTLMPHQAQAVDFCAPLDFFAIFAGYGVGKSLMALILAEIRKWKLFLIVSTKTSIQSTWPEQIKEHSDFFFVELSGSSKEKFRILKSAMQRFSMYGKNKPTLVVLINFDGIKNLFKIISKVPFQAVILDESTRVKNPDATRSQVMWALSKYIPVRGIMTGFPITDHPTEIYSQIKFLDHGATFGNSYEAFLEEYFVKKKGKYVLKPGAAKKIFNKIKHFCIMIPESVIKLPPKVFKKVALKPYEQQQRLLDSLNDQFKVTLGRVNYSTESVYALTTKAMQICDGFVTDGRGHIEIVDTPKDEAILDTLNEIGMREKVLIYANYVWSVKKLYKLLSHYGYGVIPLYGSSLDAGTFVKTFQHSSRFNIGVVTLSKGNESMTLNNCQFGMYYSRDYSNDKFGNSQARICRKGSEQFDNIFYTDFFLRGTIEEVLRNCVHDKIDVVKGIKKFFS